MENDEFDDGKDKNMMEISWKYDKNDEFYDGNDENMMEI